jgi:hypothetical protein
VARADVVFETVKSNAHVFVMLLGPHLPMAHVLALQQRLDTLLDEAIASAAAGADQQQQFEGAASSVAAVATKHVPQACNIFPAPSPAACLELMQAITLGLAKERKEKVRFHACVAQLFNNVP